MPEIDYERSDIDRIKALYESGQGLHDPSQMYAHLLILLAELDWYCTKVDATAAMLDKLRDIAESRGMYPTSLAYTGAAELVRRIVERDEPSSISTRESETRP